MNSITVSFKGNCEELAVAITNNYNGQALFADSVELSSMGSKKVVELGSLCYTISHFLHSIPCNLVDVSLDTPFGSILLLELRHMGIKINSIEDNYHLGCTR